MFKQLPNLKLLRTFECAARKKSYSLAAEELCVSQAAVSQQMRQLESQLACKLFTRQDKAMILTASGEILYKVTYSALNQLNEGIASISKRHDSHTITISSTQAFINLWLMPKLHLFNQAYPQITLKVVASAGFDDLNDQNIDLAIRFGQNVIANTPSQYHCEYFGEDKVWPVCTNAVLNEFQFKTPNELLKTWLVSLENPGAYGWSEWFKANQCDQFESHARWTYVPTTDMALNAVLNQHGVTLAAEYLCNDLIQEGKLKRALNVAHPNSVKRYFVFSRHTSKTEVINIIKQWFVAMMNTRTIAIKNLEESKD